MDVDALENFDLFMETINESMVRSSSPQPGISLTLNYSDNNAPKEGPSPKKIRAYKRKNTVLPKPLIEQNLHKKKPK